MLQAFQVCVGLCIPRIVLSKRPHEDDGDEPGQEDDHHERVEDGEPMDLRTTKGRGPTLMASSHMG
eukprot:209380-Chlamydomonas_euryale.AAC.1